MVASFRPPVPLERIAVLRGRSDLAWQARGVCNPGITRLLDGSIAMVYASYGKDGSGYLGFCRLEEDGRQVIPGTQQLNPIEILFGGKKDEFPDGYGDPRISRVGTSYYLWAKGRHNGELSANRERYGNDFSSQYVGGRKIVAFRTKDFSRFQYLGVHGPHSFDKNAFLHPDLITIGNTYYLAFFHRIQYTIQVALAPTLEHLGDREFWLDHVAQLDNFILLRPELAWEGAGLAKGWPGSISGGAPPIQIEAGLLPHWCNRTQRHWLMFYNASGLARSGAIARHRRIGAIIFSVKSNLTLGSQPFRVISRAPRPVLQPIEPYELNSRNGDVIFATGAIPTLDNKAVDVFYGSGDIVISKARFDLRELVNWVFQFDDHAAPRAR